MQPASSVISLPAETCVNARRVGIYSGSFNPIHAGHVALARYWVGHTDLDEVWLVVSPLNPFKKRQHLAPDSDRLEMARIALRNVDGVRVSDVEMHLPQPSYTIDTLRYLSSVYPQVQFVLLIGADNLEGLARWKESENLQQEYAIWVYPREGYSVDDLLEKYPQVRYMADFQTFDGCASDIRLALAQGRDTAGMLDAQVSDYIRRKGLYR